MKKILGGVVLGAGLLLLAIVLNCGGGGGGDTGNSGSTGTINASLTDTSTTDYQAIYVTVQQVAVHKDGGGGWDVISSPNKTYNLLELVNGVRENLALATLATGHYSQMRLILSDTPDNSINILSKKHPYGNYFIDNTGQSVELKVPSGFPTGIKMVKGFDINANQTTEIILDFDAARSIVKAGSSGQWLLKPTVKVMETKECSIISGNAGAEGILVSAQTYDSLAVLVEDKVQIEAATVSDGNGDYKLFLRPGSYTLVGYQDGFAPFYKNTKVVTTAGNTYTENFSLSSASTGTLSGTISISGADQEQYATISIRQDSTVNGNPEQIELKSINVANGATFTTGLPVGSYSAVISTYGKTAKDQPFTISANSNIDIGSISL
jgi:hypothetical protein